MKYFDPIKRFFWKCSFCIFYLLTPGKFKKKLKRVTFQEIGVNPVYFGKDLSSPNRIVDLRSDNPQDNEDKIIKYLKKGYIFNWGGSLYSRDVINPELVDGQGAVVTDGVWAWSDQLDHYVENYHIKIPKEFVQHMEVNHWVLPNKNTIQLEEYFCFHKRTYEIASGDIEIFEKMNSKIKY